MTSQDLYLVIGLVLAALAVPSIFGALADKHPPRFSALLFVIGGGLVVLALSQHQYTLEDIPAAFVRVAAHVLN